MSLQHIFNDCHLLVNRYESVSGGDVNKAYCLQATDSKYFLKVNDADKYPGLLLQEQNGLQALQSEAGLSVPEVIKYGQVENDQYLLMEWIEQGQPREDCWSTFGAAVAVMHKKSQSYFGWKENNFIGTILQQNEPAGDWNSFYAQRRLLPLVQKLFDTGMLTSEDLRLAEAFCKNLSHLLPEEPPALLHGDLWNGNFMLAATGEVVIFDPAVYYGHREMDVAMTRLFGGFDAQFYTAYNGIYPLEKGWQQRLYISQLYPLLVHATLFGGHYISQVKETLRR